MEYLRGWRALREDPQGWGKIGIATLILLTGMCIPIVGQIALMGWGAITLRRAISGQDTPLPRMEFDFDYLAKLLNAGFKPFLAGILWSLPVVGLVMVSYCCMYGGMMLFVGGAAAGARAGSEEGMAAAGILSMLLMAFCFFVIVVVGFALQLVAKVGAMRAEIADDINVSLRFKETMAMTRLILKELVIGSFVMGLVGMVGMFCAVLTLYIGLFPIIAVMMVIGTFYKAELYKAYLQKGGQPLPIGPLAVEGGDAPLVHPAGQTPPPQQGGYPQQPPQQGGWGPPPSQF